MPVNVTGAPRSFGERTLIDREQVMGEDGRLRTRRNIVPFRAYFIGGPLDLTVRMMQRDDQFYEVALMEPQHVRNAQQEAELTVPPRRGRYRRVGQARTPLVDAYVYAWEGEF